MSIQKPKPATPQRFPSPTSTRLSPATATKVKATATRLLGHGSVRNASSHTGKMKGC